MKKQLFFLSISVAIVIVLSGCGNDTSGEENSASSNESEDMNNHDSNSKNNDHSGMNHSSSGEVPEDLKVAQNPTYEVGSKAIIKAGHMEGMKGAEATIVGAYETIAYAISYNPTTGEERVTNHKWVIHEEILDAGKKPLSPGTEVTINASHMEGMDGATATIESAKKTTVYMIDYTPRSGGEEVKNHKWVTESELSPVKNN